MSSLLVATVVFGCAFGGGLAGIVLHGKLPEHHQQSDSKDVVKLVMGLIATIAALVLGLLIASAHSAFATQESEVQQLGVDIGQLNRVLALYGPEAKEARDLLRQIVAGELNKIWPNVGGAAVRLDAPPAREAGDELAERIAGLSPKTDLQQFAKSRALQLLVQMGETRRLLYEQSSSSLSLPFLAVLVSWLVALFVGFGLLTRYNATVFTALVVGAFCVAGAIFLILEMNRPYSGLMQISSAPIRNALDQIGR
jgi:Na+/H+ antiporter NhaC